MIHYKDMTFCHSDCTKTQCHRYFGDTERAAAERWWGGDGGAPVAFSNFTKTCEAYKAPKESDK